MKITVNKNTANVLLIAERGAVIQNLETAESDRDYNVLFMYTHPNSTLDDYPTDIQKGTELYNDLVKQLANEGYNLQGDVVFKEVVSYFKGKISTENYDFLFVPDKHVLYTSSRFAKVLALSPVMYEQDELLRHLWRKVGSLYKSLSKNPSNLFRYMYYSYLYLQTAAVCRYTPYILDEEKATEIKDVKLGGEPKFDIDSYKYDVEKLHLKVPTEIDNELQETVRRIKETSLDVLSRDSITVFSIPINSSLLAYNLIVKNTPAGIEMHINFSTHPEDNYMFRYIPNNVLRNLLKAKSFGRYFKQHIESKYTVYKNGELLTSRGLSPNIKERG